MKKKTGFGGHFYHWTAQEKAHRNLCAIAVYDFDRGVSGDLDAVYGDQIPGGALRHAAGNYSG